MKKCFVLCGMLMSVMPAQLSTAEKTAAARGDKTELDIIIDELTEMMTQRDDLEAQIKSAEQVVTALKMRRAELQKRISTAYGQVTELRKKR